jgi:hypothetical protein
MSDSRGFRRPAPLAAAMFVTWAAAMPAAAQGGPPGTPEERRACMPDVVRLCQDFVPDADKVNACLFGKQSELSPACRTVMLGHAPAVLAAVPIPIASPVRLAARTRLDTRDADRRERRKKSHECDD